MDELGQLPSDSLLAEAVGPCYTTATIAQELGYPADEIKVLVEHCRLLALTTADGHLVFPAFQVHAGRAVPNLALILRALQRGIDEPWTWALWLNSTPPVVEGIALEVGRIQQLINGEFDRVLRAAERTASSWRS